MLSYTLIESMLGIVQTTSTLSFDILTAMSMPFPARRE